MVRNESLVLTLQLQCAIAGPHFPFDVTPLPIGATIWATESKSADPQGGYYWGGYYLGGGYYSGGDLLGF